MLNVTITAVDKQLFSGDVYAVTCPGSDGEFTVLANHMPFISTLGKGEVRIVEYKEGDSKKVFAIEHGILEIANNKAVILV